MRDVLDTDPELRHGTRLHEGFVHIPLKCKLLDVHIMAQANETLATRITAIIRVLLNLQLESL